MISSPLELAARLDLGAAPPLKSAILERRGSDLTLDAAKVTHFGALALQVVRAAARTWAEDGYDLTLANVSAIVADQLALFGFTPENVTIWEHAE